VSARPSITAAIKQARQHVALVQFGRQWQVNTWSEKHRAWWQGQPTDYAKARATASATVVAGALQALGVEGWEAMTLSDRHSAGSVRARVMAALREVDA
jgi:hypothetical protein